MSVEKKRIFVGNLPPNTSPAQITKKFSKFGSVLSVEIKHRPDGSAFAFLDFEADSCSLNSCFKVLPSKKWNGYTLKLELAKESFLSRLEKERQEKCKVELKHGACSSYKTEIISNFEEQYEENSDSEKIKINTQESISERTADEASSSSDNSSDSKILYNGKLKMFKGSKNVFIDVDSSVHKTNCKLDPSNRGSRSKNAASNFLQRLEQFSEIWKDQPLSNEMADSKKIIKDNIKKERPLDEVKYVLAEEKRKKSVEEKRKLLQKQKETVKLALTSVDSSNKKNKILFDLVDKNNTEVVTKQNRPTVNNISPLTCNEDAIKKYQNKHILFEDASSEESEEDTTLKIKSQFEGNKGQKLLELQSRYANDRRFALDERFYESDENGFEEVDVNMETTDITDEKKKQLEILQSVLGHEVSVTEDKIKKSKCLSMLRFDPTKPDHSKFERKVEHKTKKKVCDISPDKQVQNQYREEDKVENDNKVVVSQEKFYEVSDCLKETLQKREETKFSLRKLFGTTSQGSDDEQTGEAYSVKTLKKNKWSERTSNPFKYDSSDSEEEIERFNCSKSDSNPQKNVAEDHFQPGESFFFKSDDYRLQDGLQFFSRKPFQDEQSYDFTKRRRELKQIIRSKVKNNLRNHRPWRKKLGGSKARKFKNKH